MEQAGPQRLRLGGDFSRLWWSAAVSSLGDGATIAAGSVVTRDAPEDRLTVARSRQQTIEGWKRPQKKA